MGKELYVVWEDAHGDVAYFTEEKNAYDNVVDIIDEMYDGDLTVADESVGIRVEQLNKSW